MPHLAFKAHLFTCVVREYFRVQQWLSVALNAGATGTAALNERPGNLTLSHDSCSDVELPARLFMLPKLHSPKSQRGGVGMAPPSPAPPAPSPGTPLTSCLCHPADAIVEWLQLGPPSTLFRSFIVALFLFCFQRQQRDATVKAGDILPLPGHL
uniref:Uncharacterized protein n=1 Tax=Knipowitschia caucasica TaxID=637954 RepID=A0AAV2LJ38_KNICA